MTAWTTDAVKPSDRFSFWREVVCQKVNNIATEAPPEDLWVRIAGRNMQFTALLAYCRKNMCNPDLSPQTVAAEFGISVRTLHLRFAQVGQTFGRWVLDHRLEACRTALRDPNQRAASICEIAYRCGFNDLSHFNKVFRARFDQTPREWRNGE